MENLFLKNKEKEVYRTDEKCCLTTLDLHLLVFTFYYH